MSPCHFPERVSDWLRVTQQAEEGLEIRIPSSPFWSHFPSRVLPWLFTSRSAPCPLDFSLTSTSETVWVAYKPHPSRIQEYSCPEVWNSPGCPWGQTLPVLCQDAVVTSEPRQPIFLSAPTCLFLVKGQGQH